MQDNETYHTSYFKCNKAKEIGEDDESVHFKVTLTKEGVMNQWYKPADEIVRIPYLLPTEVIKNGIPSVQDHPSGDVHITDKTKIFGSVTNLEVKNIKTKTGREIPAIVGIDKVPKSSPEIIEDIRNGKYHGVSIGFSCIEDKTEGEWNDEKGEGIRYVGIERNIKIWHLARMVDQKPACTPEDGCGYNKKITTEEKHTTEITIQNGDDYHNYILNTRRKNLDRQE